MIGYWFRTQSMLSLLPWLIVALAWWLGGWMLVSVAFRLEARERLLAGWGLGMVLYLWTVNLIGRWLPAQTAFTAAAALTLLAGAVVMWWRGASSLDWDDLRHWQPLAAALLANGYRYVYVDQNWWGKLPPASKQSLSRGCVQVVVEFAQEETFRKLLDLEACWTKNTP